LKVPDQEYRKSCIQEESKEKLKTEPDVGVSLFDSRLSIAVAEKRAQERGRGGGPVSIPTLLGGKENKTSKRRAGRLGFTPKDGPSKPITGKVTAGTGRNPDSS